MRFIDEHRQVFGVEPICRVLAEHGCVIAPSTYYAARDRAPSQRRLRDEQLKSEILRVWKANHRIFGARKVWIVLRGEGIEVARCTVERLMRELGITGVRRGKPRRTTIADEQADRPTDLVDRNFTALRPNQLWVADFTYVATWSGTVYVAFVIDAFSRRILGWKAATTMRTELVLDALEMAIFTREQEGIADLAGLVHHHDAGSQGGFNWSLQHLDDGGVDGQASWVDEGVDGKGSNEVAGEAIASTRRGAPVLARDRQGADQRERCGRGRRVASGRHPLVPRSWRHAHAHADPAVAPLLVF